MLTKLFNLVSYSSKVLGIHPQELMNHWAKPDQHEAIVDVRPPNEYLRGHLPGALHLDIHHPDFEQKLHQFDTQKVYYVYCRNGFSSLQACKILKKQGFSKVLYVQGGWRALKKNLKD